MKIIVSIFSLLVFTTGVGLFLIHSEDSTRLAEVQSGDLTLVCHIGDDHIEIDPALVTDYADGRWFFTNGSATQCFTFPEEPNL